MSSRTSCIHASGIRSPLALNLVQFERLSVEVEDGDLRQMPVLPLTNRDDLRYTLYLV